MLIIFIFLRAVNQSFQQGSLKLIYDLMATVGYDRCEGKKRTDGSGQLRWNDEMKPDFSPGTNARFSETEWVAAK